MAQTFQYDDNNLPKHLADTDFYFIDKFKDRIPDMDDLPAVATVGAEVELPSLISIQTRIAQQACDEDVSDSEQKEKLDKNDGIDA